MPLGGGVVILKGTGAPGAPPPGGRRGEVAEFSRASRKRLFQLLGSIDRTTLRRLPIMVTLTYPATWPADPAVWKQHLDTFGKRLRRLQPDAAIVWRIEPQRRGAPHYHLLVFGVPWLSMEWVAASWSAIVGGDRAHRDAGTRVERVRSWRGVISYASKYLAKLGKEGGPVSFTGIGRHWGVIGRKHLPTDWKTYALALGEFYQLRRILHGSMRAQGRRGRRRRRYAGLWCFFGWEDALRLLGVFAPSAELIDRAWVLAGLQAD